jgi:hypothetical protein
VPCTETPRGRRPQDTARHRRRLLTCLGVMPAGALLAALGGCARQGPPAPGAGAAHEPPSRQPQAADLPSPPSGAVKAAPAGPPARPASPVPALAPPKAARSWSEFQLQAARRLMAANPDRVYHGPVPDPLLAIPVLEVELLADGRVRGIKVLRQPTQARDTVQLAMDAIRRAAPFGSVQDLPRPWRFVEVFLFDDQRRFKPRTLDL